MKRSIIGYLLAIPVLSMGQSNYQKGYVINKTSDTLKGYIDYKPKSNALPSVNFRNDLNAETQTFTPTAIKGYGIDGLQRFESQHVLISLATTRTEALKTGIDTSSRRATVFLKVLQRGPNVTMYSYTDDIKERFYIKGSSYAEPYELMRIRYLDANNSSKVIGTDRYKGQLLFEMRSYNSDTQFSDNDFDDLAYTESEMIRIASILNRTRASVIAKNVRIFVGAGVGVSSVKYVGNSPLANVNAVQEGSSLASFNVGVDLAGKTLSERVIYRGEVSLFMGKDNKVTNGPYIHSFDHVTFYISPKVLYHVYNTQSLKAYLGIGAGGSFTSYSNIRSGKTVDIDPENQEFQEIEADMKPSSFSYNLNAGIVFKKIELTAMYVPLYKVSNYAAFNIQMGIMHVGLKFRFD